MIAKYFIIKLTQQITKFSVTNIQKCRAYMYNIIQMRFQEGLIHIIIAQTPHMTICLEIQHEDISYSEPQLWNNPITGNST